MTNRLTILSWKNGRTAASSDENPAGIREIDLSEATGGVGSTSGSPLNTRLTGSGCNWNTVRISYCGSICNTFLYPTPGSCYSQNGAPGCDLSTLPTGGR